MNCNICNTNNAVQSCEHRNILNLKKGDVVLIKRLVGNSYQKEFIKRVVIDVNNDSILCDDSIEYLIIQVKKIIF